MTAPLKTEGVIMPFGKHKDMLLTRVPRSYLMWLANEAKMETKWKDLANAELSRRGTIMPSLEISGHAIDRASLRCRKIWHETKRVNGDEEEGIYSWLMRVAGEARLTPAIKREEGTTAYRHIGMQFIFTEGEEFPVLKTVMPKRSGQGGGEVGHSPHDATPSPLAGD